jgi:hypothetical protein
MNAAAHFVIYHENEASHHFFAVEIRLFGCHEAGNSFA